MGSSLVRPCYHVVMLGLDNSGKTTLLYRLKHNMFTHQTRTIGFNCEKIYHKKSVFKLWDVGGDERTRSLWRSYCRKTDLIMFVIDSEDHERLEEAKIEVETIIKIVSRTNNVPVLILANKQDLPDSSSSSTIDKQLNLKNVDYKIIECCAVTGEGLETVFKDVKYLIQKRKENEKYLK